MGWTLKITTVSQDLVFGFKPQKLTLVTLGLRDVMP